MTFTYDATLATDLSKIRLLIGDTDSTDPLLTDEEIGYFLTLQGSVSSAAVVAARAIAAKFSRAADTSIESASVAYSQKAKAFFALSDQLAAQAAMIAGSVAGPSATGISLAGMNTADANTDRPAPAFKQGMFSDPAQRTPSDEADQR